MYSTLFMIHVTTEWDKQLSQQLRNTGLDPKPFRPGTASFQVAGGSMLKPKFRRSRCSWFWPQWISFLKTSAVVWEQGSSTFSFSVNNNNASSGPGDSPESYPSAGASCSSSCSWIMQPKIKQTSVKCTFPHPGRIDYEIAVQMIYGPVQCSRGGLMGK